MDSATSRSGSQQPALVLFHLLFLTSRMATHAILKIIDALLAVLAFGLCPVVLVAVVASIGGQVLRVTGLAGDCALLAVVGGEGVLSVVAGWRPGYCVMALCTIIAQ